MNGYGAAKELSRPGSCDSRVMRNTIPKITVRDDRPSFASPEADPPSIPEGIPVVELDSSELEDRVSAVPSDVYDALTTSARGGAIAGPMGLGPGPAKPSED